MATANHHEHYADPAELEDERALAREDAALAALAQGDQVAAQVHATLAVAARISELSVYVARLG